MGAVLAPLTALQPDQQPLAGCLAAPVTCWALPSPFLHLAETGGELKLSDLARGISEAST